MQRWKNWTSLLFAVVLSLGLVVGMAAADPPSEDGDHPGCENSGDQPKGCDDDGHPGDPGEGDDEEAAPTAPIGDACHQVIDEAVANGAPPEFEEGRQVCDALGGSQDDDDGEEPEPDPEPDPCEEDPDAEECQEENPLAPVGDGCHQVITEAVGGGAPSEIEQGRQICDALGGEQEEGGEEPEPDPEPDPCEEDPDAEECQEENPLAPVGEGCNQVITEARSAGAPPELEEGRALCDAISGDAGVLGLG